MYLVIISESFPDEDAQLLRDVGHKITTPRSIEKGQKILDKALKKNLGVPDAVIIDNALKGAQFYAKALKVSLHAGSHDTDIYLVVKKDIIAALDPEYFGISGFIEAPLASNKVLDLVGIPEEPEEGRSTPSVSEHVAPEATELKTDKRTTRPAQAEDAPAGLSQETAVAVKVRKLLNPYKLAFSSFLGIAVIFLSILGLGNLGKKDEAPPAREIPNFYGLFLEEAEALASSYDLSCEVEYAPAEDPEGTVISQFPPAGTPIGDTGSISLVVCEEKEEDLGPESDIPQPQEEQQSISEEGESGGTLLTDTPPGDVRHSPAPSPTYTDTPAATPPPATPSGSPPVALISASSTSVSSGSIVTFYASGSYDPDDGPLSYSWSCGGSGVSISREMVSNVVPGSITVTVTVTDGEGRSSSASITVSVY